MTLQDRHRRFEELLEQHKRILYKICASYCPNPAEREDLAQEIVVQLWRSFPRYDERQRFSTWMYRVGLNVAISFFRKESARTRRVLSGDEPLIVADVETHDADDVLVLYGFIERLEPLNKALVLLYLDDNSYRDIATILGLSESNVATKLSRIKQTMKREFAPAAAAQH